MMTDEEFHTYLAEKFKGEGLTPGQIALATDAVIAHERGRSNGFPTAWEFESQETREIFIPICIDNVRNTHPEFFNAAPTVAQLLALAEQEHEAKMGAVMLPVKKLAEFRRLEKLDADGRIAELGDRKAPKLDAPAPVAGKNLTGDDLDAELRKRGLNPDTMLAIDKLQWYRNLDARRKEAAATMTGSSDDPTLPLTMRMSLYRKEQAARAAPTPKQGVRDPRTGLTRNAP